MTGGCGFIGSHLSDRLIQQGTHVKVYDNLSIGTRNVEHLFGNPCFTLIEGDLRNAEGLDEALDDCQVVYHLAANPEVRLGTINTNLDFQQNLVTARNVLEAMRKSAQAKTIIFTSTSTVYGDTTEIPTNEEYGPLLPISLYGATKLGCEALISAYSHLYDIRGMIYRFANVVGSRSGHGVIYDFIRKLQTNSSTLEILGDGTQTKSYLHVDDCVDALILALRIENQLDVFNVGTEDQIDVRSIADIIVEEMELDKVTYQFTDGIHGRGWRGDVKAMLLDTVKLRKHGWKSKYTSKEAVQLAVQSMLS
ncbi:MAG: GDP-mannose 4,6-dehydratase [Candidatus Bathyarchaeota archaeon]|nr:MAG: GDP-mannose 4,6-dehydratase [Candidatus Bathyarchaeota archaeon]